MRRVIYSSQAYDANAKGVEGGIKLLDEENSSKFGISGDKGGTHLWWDNAEHRMQLSPKEFEYQFRCLYRPLNMYALRYTENLDDAEDIVQQAFSDVWEKLVGGTSIQNLKAYMYQTVRNRSLTLITNRQTHCETTELTDLEDLTEEERIIRSERDARLWTAIDHLPTERKKIFLLSKRDGLTYQEIATELGISIKTVEHQISKALKTLRETAIKIYTFFFG